MINGCKVAGGVKIGKENRNIQRKPTQVPLFPPQILRLQGRRQSEDEGAMFF
jgi:hypothetical protein